MIERVSMNLAKSRQTGMKLRSFAVGLGTLGLALALVCAPVGISDDLVSVDGKAALATPGNGISHGQGKAEFCDSFLSVLSQTPNKRGAKRDTQRSPRSLAKRALNWAAAPLGVKIVSTHDWSNTRNFIPFEITIKAAQGAGLSIGDYIDSVINNIPGATQATIDGMSRLGVFSGQIAKVVEIGPGSGRYLEKTIEACSPSQYEIASKRTQRQSDSVQLETARLARQEKWTPVHPSPRHTGTTGRVRRGLTCLRWGSLK